MPGLVRTSALATDLQLPASYRTTELNKLAASNTAGQTTEFGKVNALANWLSGPQFTYSLAAGPLSSAANLVSFLTTAKSGFCVQYAYAMTVLTRLLGFPARFVVGYTGGTRLRNGSYEVKNTDAHAWTEVYFPSLGWIRFEPTRRPGHGERPELHDRRHRARLQFRSDRQGHPNAGHQHDPPAWRRVRPGQPPGRNRRGDGGLGGRAGRHAVGGGRAGRDRGTGAGPRPDRDRGPTGPPSAGGHPDAARRRRPLTATAVIVTIAGAGLVALALYRLLARRPA